MLRIMLLISSALAACAPSPQKVAMPSPGPLTGIAIQGPPEVGQENHDGALLASPGRGGNPEQAAQGPFPVPVSAAENLLPEPLTNLPAAAQGRRTLSTAFVRVGPDGHLTVELRNGRMLVLRDVIMGPKKYCGVQTAGASAGTRYCGEYAEVGAARPGGAPVR
jgi:hypothetical protein